MQKGIKFRIYPNREQKNFIHQTLGCCRLIYNRGLAMRKESYEEGKKIGYTQTSAMLTELKRQEEFAFLKAADSIALQQSLRDLDRSFVNTTLRVYFQQHMNMIRHDFHFQNLYRKICSILCEQFLQPGIYTIG